MAKNKTIDEIFDDPTIDGNAGTKPEMFTPAPKMADTTGNKSTRLAALIKMGGQTKEDLMVAIDVNAAGLASQLSYLNTRGLNIAEVAEDKAEFPMKGDDGIYFMGTYAHYMAKRATGTTFGKVSKTRTPAEAIEFAQKREDTASNKAAKAREKHEANTTDIVLKLIYKVASADLDLASAKLSAVEAGNYSYESFTVTTV